MPTSFFEKARYFDCEEELRKVFNCASINLLEGCQLLLEGNVKIHHNVTFSGNCEVYNGCEIGIGSVLDNVNLGAFSQIKPYSVLEGMVCGESCILGPFCYIRGGTKIGDNCILGSHLEVTRSSIGDRVKISHQGFVGDGRIHNDVVLGSGTVFCNWETKMKNITIICQRTSIGSGTMIIAPCNVGSGVIIGAGSVIKGDVKNNERIIQKRK